MAVTIRSTLALALAFGWWTSCVAFAATVTDDSNWSPDEMMEGSMIDSLSKRLWDDRGLRSARLRQEPSVDIYRRFARAMRSMIEGDDDAALRELRVWFD